MLLEEKNATTQYPTKLLVSLAVFSLWTVN